MAIRLLHLADLHLGANGGFQGERAETRRKDFQAAFDKSVEFALAVETRVDAVVICGDLFDTHAPAQPLLHHVHAQFNRLREQDIPIILIPGFHDAIVYPDCVYRTETFAGTHALLDAEIKQPISFDLKGTPVHFYGFAWNEPQKAHIESFRRLEVPGLHIALLHGEVEQDDTPSGAPVHFKVEDLETTGMHYVALGYRHNYEVVHANGPTVVYPGTLEPVYPDEAEPRAFLVATFEMDTADPDLTLTRVPYKARPVVIHQVDVATLGVDDHASLVGSLMRIADPHAMARIVLVGATEFIIDPVRVKDKLSHHFFSLEVEDRTIFSESSVVQLLELERTIRGIFTHHILELMRRNPDAQEQATLEYALKSGLQRFLEGELL